MKKGISLVPYVIYVVRAETVIHLSPLQANRQLWRIFINLINVRGITWIMPDNISETLVSWDELGQRI